MPDTGTIRGTHHVTFCVGGAQEDYDFHVRTLKSVKKTVLFDGEIPIYHLYYGNETGDISTLLTSFPYRQAEWMGQRGTNQAKQLNLSVSEASISYWAERLKSAGIEAQELDQLGVRARSELIRMNRIPGARTPWARWARSSGSSSCARSSCRRPTAPTATRPRICTRSGRGTHGWRELTAVPMPTTAHTGIVCGGSGAR